MAREDIERLQQKIAKDPDSKLFVPLAEEYKKAGMVDEAINLLIQGLEKQPNYLSARVSLGKIYMGKGLLNEARDEFQKVIAIIPDNLYAHKKLAEIYQELGERDNAMKELHSVLNLNPTDEWAVSSLSAIEQETQQIPEEKPYEIPPATVDEEPAEMPLQAASGEEVKYMIEEQRDEDHATVSLSEEGSEIPEAPTDVIGELQEELETPSGTPLGAEQVAPEQPDEEETSSLQDTVQEPVPVYIAPDAETYIKQGNYTAAMNTYKTILSEDPDNKQVLQRVAELKALLKMIGKDQEAHILKLEGFLEGINKRRNEFFGNT
jgi:tetratricopeptide (TPR) repeat protein